MYNGNFARRAVFIGIIIRSLPENIRSDIDEEEYGRAMP